MVQPEQLLNMLEGLQLRDVHESIPRKDFLTYYNFELVSATVLTENGLNIQLNIPVHHTDGYHDVYRAIAVPQPITMDPRPLDIGWIAPYCWCHAGKTASPR